MYYKPTLLLLPLLYCTFLLISCSSITNSDNSSYQLQNSYIIFADSSIAAKILTQPDYYTNHLSQTDLIIKTRNPEAKTTSDYLLYAAQQVSNWPTSAQSKVLNAFDYITQSLLNRNIQLNLPDTIYLIHSTCNEEGGELTRGYTRHNAIVLNEVSVANQTDVNTLTTHELFHIFSRHNPLEIDSIYHIIGFDRVDTLSYPDSLSQSYLSNPDAPIMQHAFSTLINNKPHIVTPVHYFTPTWTFFTLQNDFRQNLMTITVDTLSIEPLLLDTTYSFYEKESIPEFFQRIGRNTNYTAHPEEISAEHFTLLLSGSANPNQDLIDSLLTILQ